MKMEKNIKYYSSSGKENLIQLIKELRQRITNNAYLSEDEKSFHDGLAENAGFQEKKRISAMLAYEMEHYLVDLENYVVLDPHNNPDTIDLEDYVLINMKIHNGVIDTFVARLSGQYLFSKVGDEVSNITINSPLGRSIYNRPVGFSGKFVVGQNENEFEILRKGKSLEDLVQQEEVQKKK